MNWTTQKPTEPGYYWFKRSGERLATIAQILSDMKALCIGWDPDDIEPLSTFPLGCLWAGPIAPPEAEIENARAYEPWPSQKSQTTAPTSLFGDDELPPQHTYGRNGR